jgi:hypothetical protein
MSSYGIVEDTFSCVEDTFSCAGKVPLVEEFGCGERIEWESQGACHTMKTEVLTLTWLYY